MGVINMLIWYLPKIPRQVDLGQWVISISERSSAFTASVAQWVVCCLKIWVITGLSLEQTFTKMFKIVFFFAVVLSQHLVLAHTAEKNVFNIILPILGARRSDPTPHNHMPFGF